MSHRPSLFSLLTSLCLLMACTGAPVVTPTVAPTTAPTATELVATETVMPSPVPPTETASLVPPTDTPTIPAPTLTPAPLEQLAFIARTSTLEWRLSIFMTYLPDEVIQLINFVKSDGSDLETPTIKHNQDVIPPLKISADGRKLGFSTFYIGPEVDQGDVVMRKNRYITDLPTTSSVVEPHSPAETKPSGDFAWGANSEQVALTWEHDDNNLQSVFVWHLDTRQATSVTQNSVGGKLYKDLYPSWSPDGKYIAFVRWEYSGKGASFPMSRAGTHHGVLYLVRPDGSELHPLVDPVYIETADVGEESDHYRWVTQLAWSPDSQWIAYLVGATTSDISIINIETGETRLLTNDPARDLSPSWSPDGSLLVFFSKRDGDEEIYVITIDGKLLINLTQHSSNDFMPVWSPSGQRIAFLSNRDSVANKNSGGYQLFVMNADGSNVIRVSSDYVFDPPIWIP